tara:strand:- start:28 stop:198 length:171 start_codon:yes stop_codon:yes gene_type:complete
MFRGDVLRERFIIGGEILSYPKMGFNILIDNKFCPRLKHSRQSGIDDLKPNQKKTT